MILIKQESNYKFITKYLLVYDMIQKKNNKQNDSDTQNKKNY